MKFKTKTNFIENNFYEKKEQIQKYYKKRKHCLLPSLFTECDMCSLMKKNY